jgi:CheY-like chemotaxis protein
MPAKDPRKKEFSAWMIKPVKTSQMFSTLSEVLSSDFKQYTGQSSSTTQEDNEYDPTLGKRCPLQILIAEDNSINQQLALLTLERLGYIADVAGNGLEVIDALNRQPYDIILMDIQMPEMDGLSATKRIRKDFPPISQPKIVAMTANALQGDREMCLSAGMDDYISKPFRVKELVRVLEQTKPIIKNEFVKTEPRDSNMKDTNLQPEVIKEEKPKSELPLYSNLDGTAIQRLKGMLGKKVSTMLPKLLDDFFRDAAKMQLDARTKLEQGQSEDLRRIVHTLKANAKNFGANTLGELCQQAENAAKAGTLDGLPDLLSHIEAEYAKVKPELEILRNSV